MEENSIYLSTSVEEPELDSINFRQSLRFFQDQLILNKKEFPSSTRDSNNDIGIDFMEKNNPIDHLILRNKDRNFEEMSKPLNSSKISIPTVDTILESVRVLRAIQKSQEQRGSSWSLNMTQSETDFIHQQSLSLDNVRDGSSNGFHDNDDTLSTSTNSPPSDYFDATSTPKTFYPVKSDEAQSFWPSHRVLIQENVSALTENGNATEKDADRIGPTAENDRENENIGKTLSHPDGVVENNSEETNIENTSEISRSSDEVENLSQNHLQSVSSTVDETASQRFIWDFDLFDVAAVTKICPQSPSWEVEKVNKPSDEINTDISDNFHDISELQKSQVMSEIATMEENNEIQTSAIDPSFFQLVHLRPESRSDTCSTYYMSAECSPCPSLHIDFEPLFQEHENNQTYSSQYTNDESKKDSPFEGWPATSSKVYVNTETEFEGKESNYLLSSQLTDTNIFENNQNPEALFVENTSSQTALDAVIKNQELPGIISTSAESVLDGCETHKTTHIGLDEDTKSEETSNIILTSTENVLDDHQIPQTLLESPSTETILDADTRNEELSNISTSTENVITSNSAEDAYNSCCLLELKSSQPSSNSTKISIEDDLVNFPNENKTNVTNKNYQTVNNILNDRNLNKNEDKIKEFNTSQLRNTTETDKLKAEEDKSEIHGIKKFITSSWNLEAILESLYTLPRPKPAKVFETETTLLTEILVMSAGAFYKYPMGDYTLELQKQSVIIKQETKVLLSLPVNYMDISMNADILQLDNRMGRCLFIKCKTSEELLALKEKLEAHCLKNWTSESINLVHYPLKYHQNVIIIDLGSCSTRAGILMDQPTLPFIFFPSVCATDKITGNHIYGKEALQSDVRQNSNLSFPLRPSIKIIKHSIDVDLLEGLFKKIFQDLRVDPTQYAIQVCLPRSLSIQTQNELVKLLLENLKVQSVSLTHQALLTLYAHNVSTGIVVDVGDRMDILPVVDGFIVENGVTRIPYGGQRLIHHMKHALAEKHISLSNDIDSFVVQFISENLSYIAEDYEKEIEIATQCRDVVKKTIALESFTRDHNCIQHAILDEARFKVPEGLFKPSLWGLDNPGVHQLVQKAIQATSVDVRKKIAENIYVSGGVTLTPGFVERLHKEVSTLNKPRIIPKVIASKYRYHCTYIGACEFARMEVFPKVCVTAEEYRKKQLASLKKFPLCF